MLKAEMPDFAFIRPHATESDNNGIVYSVLVSMAWESLQTCRWEEVSAELWKVVPAESWEEERGATTRAAFGTTLQEVRDEPDLYAHEDGDPL